MERKPPLNSELGARKFESVGIEQPACDLCGRITYRLNKVCSQYQCGPCANGEPSWDIDDFEDQGSFGDRRHNGESMRLLDWESEPTHGHDE